MRVMTIHAAKGLEFPVVFLAALHKGIKQDVASLCFSPRVGLGARWMNPAGDDRGDWFHAAIREEAGRRENEEGNRLFYVAMTRTRDCLYILQPHRFYTRGRPNSDNHVYAPRTRFIPDALLPLFERRAHGTLQMTDSLESPLAARVDVQARLREMWG